MAKFQPGNPGGPGRPRKADRHAGAITKAEKQIADRLPALIDAQIDLALGVTVQEIDRESGAAIVYTRPPDAKAGQYLIDRIMGKPTERKEIDHTGELAIDTTLKRALDTAYGDDSTSGTPQQ